MAHTPHFRKLIRILQLSQRENLKAEGKPLPRRKEQAQWTRRRFIKLTTLATGSALATGLSGTDKALGRLSYNPNLKIAVIGGGIAGLNAAYQLKKMGLRATVYEASSRLGGRILSITGAVGEGLVSDLGAHFINTDHADLLQLANEFDLNLFNRTEDAQRFPFPETAYYFDGKIRTEAEVAEKLRPLAEQISYDADLLDI